VAWTRRGRSQMSSGQVWVLGGVVVQYGMGWAFTGRDLVFLVQILLSEITLKLGRLVLLHTPLEPVDIIPPGGSLLTAILRTSVEWRGRGANDAQIKQKSCN
jgi:hypothetical protein